MKRLALFVTLILLLALAACDTMGPKPPELLPTSAAPAGAVTEDMAPPASDLPETPADAPADAGSDLFGVTWEWSILLDPAGQTGINDPTRYTVVFNPDGSMNVQADCNTAILQFVTDGHNIQVLPGPVTLAACGPDSQDQLFINSLSAAESYSVQDGELLMTLRAGSGTIMFRTGVTDDTGEVPDDTHAQALTGVTWEWISTATAEETIEVNDPSRYQITFNDDGTLVIKADCNNVIGSYAAGEDGTMTITLGPSTLVACPEDSQADLLTVALPNVALYSFIDGDLVLDLPSSSGSIRLRAAGEAGTGPALAGIVWEWISTTAGDGVVTANDPSRYQITFNEDGTLLVKADCNNVIGSYTTGEGGAMTITLGPSTLVACPEDSQADLLTAALPNVALYSFIDGDLVLDLPYSSGSIRLRAAGEVETGPMLTGVTWQWNSTTTAIETITVEDPSRYTIVFFDDGTAGIKADCNVGNAEYTAGEDGSISLTLGAMTRAFCPESQDQVFLAGLQAAAVYSFADNGDLLLDMIADSGTMRFAGIPDETAEGAQGPSKGDLGIKPPIAKGNELTGTPWQLTRVVKSDGEIVIPDPSRYTITFNADGTANFQADCNSGSMGYTTGDGGTITTTPGPITMAYCGPASFDQFFLGGLTNASSYAFQDGNLAITMLYESGTLVFAPVQ